MPKVWRMSVAHEESCVRARGGGEVGTTRARCLACEARTLVRPTDLTDLEDCEAMIDETRAALGPIERRRTQR